MKVWLYRISVILALIAYTLAVWFAAPLIGFGETRPFDAVWVRLLVVGVVWLVYLVTVLVKWLRRRKAARALEDALVPPMPTGDGQVLAEKMTEALDVLKKSSGSKAFLYDLPWYVIIGPPGAGKTTALLNSGIKFPLSEKTGGAVAGFGGTRHCDWWFSEEAVLIDTAGRYTTQDSDAEADRESWMAFLKLLKTHRAKQPINGVILAISLEEVMKGTRETIDAHAETIRQRLVEIHDQLKVDFPVYVMFTKADLIAGFMEYFGSFSASRRQKVWGATFQTANRKEATAERFGSEYDALVNRLSEEVTDRLNEEPDGVSRIAIFGFPGQVAMLKDRLNHLVQAIFESSRYKINANLRGFYFSSGTQEGTPIDQVLGAMERSFGGVAGGAAMSGKGKSFFLHDLLRKVIFAEAGWVNYDSRAVRRDAILRYGAFGAITLGIIAMLSLWGWSFWQNRQLIQTAQAALAEYELAAQDELAAVEVQDDDVLQIAGLLQTIRDMPLGYGDAQDDRSFTERFGLSQRSRLTSAATTSYRQALERMLRSRLLLRIEQQLQDFMNAGETLSVYEALKVYKLLGGVAPRSDDQLVVAWFREDWRSNLYPGPQFADSRLELEEHLVAMMQLDDAHDPTFELNGPLIDNSERTIARMNVADQAYSLIKSTAAFAGVEDFRVALRSGPDAELVFETIDGKELEELVIPGIYTYFGFHEFFLPQLAEVAQKLSDEQWVMGTYAETAEIEEQVGKLGPQLLNRYTDDFIASWDGVLDNVKLKPMSADRPAYRSLAAASAPRTSPIFLLSEAIMVETRLTREFTEEGAAEEGGLGAAVADGSVVGEVGSQIGARIRNRTSGLARIGIDVAMSKSQRRAGGAFAGSGGGEQQLPGAAIEAHFREYADLFEGDAGQRRIDLLLVSLAKMQEILLVAETNASVAAAQMPGQLGSLKAVSSRLPATLNRIMNEAVEDFEGDAANTSIAQLNNDLNVQVTLRCTEIVENRYPFARSSTRDVPMAEFAALFAPNGALDRFFLQNLSTYADMSGDDWIWKADSPLGSKLSAATLKQFQRAADIRDAFFPLGGAQPSVDITILQNAMHDRVKEATLEVNGNLIKTRPVGNTPMVINWPGSASAGSASISLRPKMGGRETEKIENGAWALMRLLDAGAPKLSGDTIRTRYVIGGRHIGYDFKVDARLNPFYLRALSEFKCPNGL